jgi:hypothetical protein
MYKRMVKVLVASMRVNSPETPIEVFYRSNSDSDLRKVGVGQYAGYTANARKTRHYCELVQMLPDGEQICLLDCDTFVLKSLKPLEEIDADLAYTTRDGSADFLINTGLVLLRATPCVKEFFRRWHDTAMLMLAYPSIHAQYKPRYGGINQSSLMRTIETHPHPNVTITTLHCAEWNAYRESWSTHARVVHLVGDLRKKCLHRLGPSMGVVADLANLWKQYERNQVSV